MTLAFDENALRAALGRAAASVGATAVVGPEDDLALRVDHRIAVHERRAVRRRRAVVGALAAFVLVVGIVAYAVRNESSDPSLLPATPRTGEPGWAPMAAAPIAPRVNHTQIWTGRELIVFGGFGAPAVGTVEARPVGGAAAYDPALGTWRRLADPPADVDLTASVSLWTGTELLVLSKEGPLFAYDPADDGWQTRAENPQVNIVSGLTTAVWTGTEVLVFTGIMSPSTKPREPTAYDPTTDSWRTLAVAPLWAYSGDAVWTGSRLLVVGRATLIGSSTSGQVWSLDPVTDQWERLADPPIPHLSERSLPFLVWTGTEIVMGGGSSSVPGGSSQRRSDAAAYDPAAGTWRVLPNAPVPVAGLNWYEEIWTGSEVLAWASPEITSALMVEARPILLDPVAGTWRVGALAPERGRQGAPTTWTGHELLWWSGEAVAGDPRPNECCTLDAGGSSFTP